jgi:deoxyribonuclease-4
MSTKKSPLLGAHVSAAGGLYKAIENGERIGAECVQIFGASPRSYAASLPTPDAVKLFKDRLGNSPIKSVYQHGAYLVNLGSSDVMTIKKSVANLSAHLQIANLIGSEGLVFHVGSPNGEDRKEALDRAVEAMKEVLKKVTHSAGSGQAGAFLVMENSGSQKKIGGSITDLEYLFKKVADSRVKICIDTAHSFESGLIESYTPVNIKKFFDAWDSAVGIENVVALHANDSKTPYNSQNDKHENIGEGFIGIDGFKNLAKEKMISHTRWFLEVPGFDDLGPDKRNMDLLKSCFSEKN